MKLFLDSLDRNIIRSYANMGILEGVTTNPTMAKRFDMRDDIEMVQKVHDALGGGEVHVEAFGDSETEIVRNAERLSGACEGIDLVFKIPFGVAGVAASRRLVTEGHKTSLHLVYSINQALLASVVGSTYICPLAGRLDDIGHDALENIDQILSAFRINGATTRVVVSSVRHPQHVIRAFRVGADAATVPANVMAQMFQHPLTHHGVSAFRDDIELLKPVASRHIDTHLVVQDAQTLRDVLTVLASNKGGAVAVCCGTRLSGIFTTGDLKRLINQTANGFSMDDPVSKHMTKGPITVDSREETATAVALVKKHNIEQLVVVENGAVLGVLSSKDLL